MLMLVRLISLTTVTVENNSIVIFTPIIAIGSQLAKKALTMSAFFASALLVSLFVNSAVYAKNCTSTKLSGPEYAVVKWVYDGDTLLLTDKRKIRIIGIDTPETKHHKQQAQAYGAKAREALRALLKEYDYRIVLRYGKGRKDRYKRTLAHVFLPDGTNISSWLLERGYAKTLAFPPNVALANCYSKIEHYAQSQSLRIWKYKKNSLRKAESLPARVKGYVYLKGYVKRLFSYRKSTIIELESNSRDHIQLKIKKKNVPYFKDFDFDSLRNREIRVSGFLKNKRNKRTLYLNHPSQIEVNQRSSVSHGRPAPNNEAIFKKRAVRNKRAASKASLKWSLEK